MPDSLSPTITVDEWAEVMMDALRASDSGDNPFYSDDEDTISLARQLGEAVVARLVRQADGEADDADAMASGNFV